MHSKYSTSSCFANFIVIAFIPTLFFLGIVAGYLKLAPLTVPLHGLVIITFIYLVFLLFVSHNANYSICKIRSSYLKLNNEIDKALDKTKLEIENQNKSLLDIDRFLQDYYNDVRNDNFASVASSIFPMLGILGTFLSIALSMPDFSVKDTAALDHEISLLLNGVGSAFYASIYGILLSLIWTYFEKRGLSKIKHFFEDVKHEFSHHIWSKEELDIYRYKQYNIKTHLNLDFIENLTQAQLKAFKEISQYNRENFTELTKRLTDTAKTLTDTLTVMQQKENALEAQERIEQNLKDFTHASSNLEKTLHRTFDKIDAEIGNIVIKLADFATHVSLETQEVQRSIASYHKIVAENLKQKSSKE